MYAGHSDSAEGDGRGGETLKCGGRPCPRVMTGWGVLWWWCGVWCVVWWWWWSFLEFFSRSLTEGFSRGRDSSNHPRLPDCTRIRHRMEVTVLRVTGRDGSPCRLSAASHLRVTPHTRPITRHACKGPAIPSTYRIEISPSSAVQPHRRQP